MTEIKTLRKKVSFRRDDVWCARGGKDAYTRSERSAIVESEQNVDHVLEVQLLEHAVFDIVRGNREVLERVRTLANNGPLQHPAATPPPSAPPVTSTMSRALTDILPCTGALHPSCRCERAEEVVVGTVAVIYFRPSTQRSVTFLI